MAAPTASGWRAWLDRIIRYAPVISLVLGWLTVIAAAATLHKPAIWWLTIFTLPVLGSTLYAGYRVHQGVDLRDPAVGREAGPGAASK